MVKDYVTKFIKIPEGLYWPDGAIEFADAVSAHTYICENAKEGDVIWLIQHIDVEEETNN